MVPQKIGPSKIRKRLFSKLFPWPAIQVDRTLLNPVIEAWSGDHKIWKRSYRKLIANIRIPLSVEKFDWNGVDSRKGVILKAKETTN